MRIVSIDAANTDHGAVLSTRRAHPSAFARRIRATVRALRRSSRGAQRRGLARATARVRRAHLLSPRRSARAPSERLAKARTVLTRQVLSTRYLFRSLLRKLEIETVCDFCFMDGNVTLLFRCMLPRG